MKNLILILTLTILSLNVFAQEQPAYLKDAVITVKLTNGKTYKYSANEYAVVKRDSMGKDFSVFADVISSSNSATRAESPLKRNRNIISIEAVSSERGFTTSSNASTISVETRRKLGVGVMYQNNFYEDFFLGGRLDTNRSGAINFGYGF